MSINLEDVSVVYWFPERDKHRCGYCKQENSAISYGMWADTMTVDDYQDIIDRGWRRSGKYCYKPIMNETCCPQYTIRCDAVDFKVSKSQKKVTKKFNKFLSDGILNKEQFSATTLEPSDLVSRSDMTLRDCPSLLNDYKQLDKKMKIDEVDGPSARHEFSAPPSCSSSRVEVTAVSSEPSKRFPVRKGEGPDPSKPPSQKAKAIRLERKRRKLEAKGLRFDDSASGASGDKETKSLVQFLGEVSDDPKHKLQIKLYCTSQPDNVSYVINSEHKVYQKYQTIIHDDPPEKCSVQSFKRFLIQTPLKIKLTRIDCYEETFEISAKLFEKYQMTVHGEKSSDCSVDQFVEFLVDTPLMPQTSPTDDTVTFGSFHQQYWIDDKLIAVGVIDILPKCISSVYFFYDPDYRSLTLGTYGSLREVEFAQNLNKKLPDLRYYYMGFYIHSCDKMRYKGKLCPSDLLCPETYCWFPIEKCIPKLDASKYSRLNDNPAAIDQFCCSPVDIESIKILIDYQYTTFKYYRYKSRDFMIYQTIGKLIGRKCIGRFMFIQQKT